jgi:hypothetical protein
VKRTSYEAPYYAVFSNLLSLHLSLIQIFSSAPCSQTPPVCVPPLMTEPKIHPIQNHRQNYSFVYSNFYFFLDSRQDKLFWTECGDSHYFFIENNNAVSSSDCMVSSGLMISEWWIKNDMKGSSFGLIWHTVLVLPKGAEESNMKFQSR